MTVRFKGTELRPVLAEAAVNQCRVILVKDQGVYFEMLIRKRQYLPNPVARGFTTSLKIRPMHRFLRRQGWTDWDQFIGICADEQRRIAKIRAPGHSTECTH
jgi:3'-phosphoadenosine 5'-phosphosulfate sulfotransferase (PAPS reductase)/FAD synthetase